LAKVHPAQIDFERAGHFACRQILEDVQIKDLVLFGIDSPFNPIPRIIHKLLLIIELTQGFSFRSNDWIERHRNHAGDDTY